MEAKREEPFFLKCKWRGGISTTNYKSRITRQRNRATEMWKLDRLEKGGKEKESAKDKQAAKPEGINKENLSNKKKIKKKEKKRKKKQREGRGRIYEKKNGNSDPKNDAF